MKRSTAIGHLVELADVAQEQLRFRETDIGWPLEELWATGPFLDGDPSFDAGAVVLVLDAPADELPWLARTSLTDWVDGQLRLPNRSLRWSHRPAAWPAWNCDDRVVLRFWSATEGLDQAALDALRGGRPDAALVVAPTDVELRRQFEHELAASRAHLRLVLDRYWDRDWRREHKGFGAYPEDHLWRAATAVSDLHDAVERLSA